MEPISVQGQLVHQRKLSRKCSFFDVVVGSARVEAILKIQDDLSVDDVKALRSRLVLGDIVKVDGVLETLPSATRPFSESPTGYLLHARDITVLTPWKEAQPGKTFTPVPVTTTTTTATQSLSKEAQAAVPCKFWINTGRCHKGAACPMRHDDVKELKALRKAWLADRLHKKRLVAHQADDPTDPHAKQSKHNRAGIFAKWLVETFGIEMLQSGSGVMDVAGGRGGVCFELWHQHKIPTTLVDPRPMKYTKRQHQYLQAHVGEAHVPQWLELFEEASYVGATADETKVEHMHHVSLLLGMHPDEATDVIVDVALAFNKPFAIVPCCVFADKFPHRRTPSGDAVTTYDELVAYLVAKHPRIQTTFLPFDGRNRVVYYQP
ncbi:hypothetical protein SDRG_07648 [Saprolegnia diclina VS20]|uniref:C3H1-type domain-containing protein n=1 Tax=Saprolegnia diclina (strain VS20) TaxID=1156394 RepID=T0QAB2_SAPDV|nr:hypothetical protein SDRG_07648 [Saprolegnia diclina VS20]EQC34844.1 hypothetical protein SDRG_07648 [Saprolegnia diclina VS20]|eukprot:XP_008611716.1 hypothetical protein SDRG_07648 [Saprolegnia diclina VS20]